VEKLILKDINFRFPGQKFLLEKINLTIEKGKVISLVGESGCGKSTLASIAMRFYSPESGNILINDDLDAFKFQVNAWRSKIAIIPQEIHIFNGTILQNLIAEVDKYKISELIKTISELELATFIDSFPNGLMTLVGEAGINLSGGQKQMLAFIRVLITKPDILIIDEGTSNMDRATEVLIIELINKIKSRMGILMISHKINMIKKLSDLIYVIEARTISAIGSHDDLINGSNIYNKFWKDFN
jgi:ATP-binding cassette subfamily B protein